MLKNFISSQNLSKQRLRNVWNCEKHDVWLDDFHPDVTEMVDGALKTNYLPTYLPTYTGVTRFFVQQHSAG